MRVYKVAYRRAVRWSRFLVAGACPLALLLCTGCLQYHEDMWVYEDHSGRMESQVRIPTAVWTQAVAEGHVRPGDLRAQCDRIVAEIAGAELVAFKEITTSEHHRVSWTIAFSDPIALQNLLAVGTQRTMEAFGAQLRYVRPEAEVDRLGRLTTVYRMIPAWPQARERAADFPVIGELQARFRVHAPEPIVASTDVTVTGDGRTASWEMTTDELFARGLEQRVSFRRPFPIAPVAGSVAGLVFAIGGIWGFAYKHMARGLRALPDAPAPPPAPSERATPWDDSFPEDEALPPDESFPPDELFPEDDS